MICGIDEAGRGPLAGALTVAAVILPEDFPCHELNDSKKLSPNKREQLAILIKEKALDYSIVFIDEKKIDEINIFQATLLGMKLAAQKLAIKPDRILVDGNRAPKMEIPCEAIVKGDSLIPQIMAASILAKTERDHYMQKMSQIYPQWQFDKHKGYPTRLHRQLCQRYGLSPIHRKSFRVKAVD